MLAVKFSSSSPLASSEQVGNLGKFLKNLALVTASNELGTRKLFKKPEADSLNSL